MVYTYGEKNGPEEYVVVHIGDGWFDKHCSLRYGG